MKYCPYEKYLYCLDNADEISIRRQKETRSGIDNSEDEFEEIDEIIYKTVVEQKQSIHHCLVANKDKIKKSEKTIYNWIDEGILKTKNIDLPRKTGFKIRKHKIPDKYDYNHKKISTEPEDFIPIGLFTKALIILLLILRWIF